MQTKNWMTLWFSFWGTFIVLLAIFAYMMYPKPENIGMVIELFVGAAWLFAVSIIFRDKRFYKK